MRLRRPAATLTLAVALAGPSLVEAGLRFRAVPGPPGLTANAMAGDGTTLWVGSARGVWRLDLAAGTATVDGLSDRTVVAVAVADGAVWAADGVSLFRRAANGTWSAESAPGVSLPSALAADGGTLYAGGIGVARRASGSWTALASPTGYVISLFVNGSDLWAGLQAFGTARFSGSAWTPTAGGLGGGETVRAFASAAGTLYSGTDRAAYAWTGSAWAVEAALGTRDVRGLSGAGGTLRAATADAGVFEKSGSAWTARNVGLVATSVLSFASLGSTLYAGTNGGPVYRLSGSSWDAAGLPAPGGTTVTSAIAFSTGAGPRVAVGTAGGGLTLAAPSDAAPPAGPASPAGCGNVFALAPAPGGANSVVAATGCGPLLGDASSASLVGAGLPPGARLTTLAIRGGTGTVIGGTAQHGVHSFGGSSWSTFGSGLPSDAAVAALSSSLVATDRGVFALDNVNAWRNASAGLPSPGAVVALSEGWAALPAGGTFERVVSGTTTSWRRNAAGLAASPALGLFGAGAAGLAAAGTSGVFVRRDGGWQPERSGLPAGADVRFAGDGFVGTAGHGAFSFSTAASIRTIPVVLDVTGATGARFRTELAIVNRSATAASVKLTFFPAEGFGLGTVPSLSTTAAVPARGELRIADAITYLFQNGGPQPPIPAPASVAGSVSLEAVSGATLDQLYAEARTYTGGASGASGGTFGLFYDAPSDVEAAEEAAYVYGLRSVSGEARSNLAVVRVPGRDTAPVTLSIQVFDRTGVAAGAPIVVTLGPGEWKQVNEVLRVAGLPDGSYGWARIMRTAGIGAWIAYGVVNDARTSDGSYIQMVRPGGLSATRDQIVPVVLDVFGANGSRFTTELTLVNDGVLATPADLVYSPAPGFGEAPGVPVVTVSLAAREQRTIPDVIRFLRENGINVPDPTTSGPQAGTLSVLFRNVRALDEPRTLALARTTTPNPDAATGGRFGLFYAAVARGGGARTTATVPALTDDAAVRSNLALVHAGGGSSFPLALSVEIFDAATGAKVGSTLTKTLEPGEWYQFSRVLRAAGVPESVTRAYAVVTRTAGDDSFLAYGVLNDNVTSDGSFLRMVAADSF